MSADAADLQSIKDFLDKGIKIPPQPKALLEIETLSQRPHVSNQAIAKVISSDAGLVAALFKVVNSPAMGMSRKVDSVESAIAVLGLKQITNLVKCVALKQAVGGNGAVYEKFWERSGGVAQLAAIVAKRQVSVCNVFPDQAYLAGLFYECGVPLLMQRFPEYARTFRLSENGDWPELSEEDSEFDTDHSVVGYLVSRYWHLPEFIAQAILHHHDIEHAKAAARSVVAILMMAVHLYHRRYQIPGDPGWEKNRVSVLDELGLNEDGLQEFEEDVLDAVAMGE